MLSIRGEPPHFLETITFARVSFFLLTPEKYRVCRDALQQSSTNYNVSVEQLMDDLKIKDGHIFKSKWPYTGTTRVYTTASHSASETNLIQKLTLEYNGTQHLLEKKEKERLRLQNNGKKFRRLGPLC